ncbi:rhodanese [Vagococcus penaei]|uniref:Rhodanese n=1 Tax=Vagococcus penaei TaxID=633807 RepID=A0A1Q2D5R0_9ENTE|nr:rhodanese-like domain-containing protein [Vagococcus penaei]AQP53719.1 rhodanese [Vagococcus penaei]RST99467.1 rhodanese [Vagococcus penaei]
MFGLFQRIPSITTNELANKLTKQTLLLDVRTAAEFQNGHIPQAKNVPLNRIGSYEPKSSGPVYVICQSGMRSKKASKVLKNKGFDVINVRGGMSHWAGTTKRGR